MLTNLISIGSIVVAVIALYQSNKALRFNKERRRNDIKPNLEICGEFCGFDPLNKKLRNWQIDIKNTGHIAFIENVIDEKNDVRIYCESKGKMINNKDEFKIIVFSKRENQDCEELIFELTIFYNDNDGNNYKQIIKKDKNSPIKVIN